MSTQSPLAGNDGKSRKRRQRKNPDVAVPASVKSSAVKKIQRGARLRATTSTQLTTHAPTSPASPGTSRSNTPSRARRLARSNSIGDLSKLRSARPKLSAEGLIDKCDATTSEFVPHWCVLCDGELNVYKHREIGGDYHPQLGILPAPCASYNLRLIRGIEASESKTEFKIITDEVDSKEARFRCRDQDTARYWFFTMQRSVVNSVRKRKLTGLEPRSARVVRRHTVAGGPVWGGLSATHVKVGSFYEVFYASDTGRRRNMEDRTVLIHDLNRKMSLDTRRFPPQAFLGVYDGHGGSGAVDFTMQQLHKHVCEHEHFHGDVERALRDAFVQCDTAFRKQAVVDEDISGTTATVVLVRGRRLIVANCGDCRAVMCRSSKAVSLSHDHKPHREDEKMRVESAGGWIESVEVLNVPRLIALGLEDEELDDDRAELVGWVTVHRVNGCLGVTRSLGDILIKDLKEEQFEDVEFSGELVVSEPDVESFDIVAEDEFVIVASDGLWDVFSSQEAVEWVRERVEAVTAVRAMVVEELVNEAIERGSLDNISVIVAFFDHDKAVGYSVEGYLDVFDMKTTSTSQWVRRFCVLDRRTDRLLFYRHRREALAAATPRDVVQLGKSTEVTVHAIELSESAMANALEAVVSNLESVDIGGSDEEVPFGDLLSPRADETQERGAFCFQLTINVQTLILKATSDEERVKWIRSFDKD